MDGSKYFEAEEPARAKSSATRLALSVDRDAVGLMKHASELGHLVEWWLQTQGDALGAMSAFRIGRKLERFRLAARLAEGKGSKQLVATLDALQSELNSHAAPAAISSVLAGAQAELRRLQQPSKPPPTVMVEAFRPDPERPATQGAEQEDDEEPPRKRRLGAWLLVLVIAGGGLWWASMQFPGLAAQLPEWSRALPFMR